MLFYETEGEFGDEGFKVIAKGLFLLDIGNKTYTEYDPSDPELIKFLGNNPEALMMKKGHIHSHNTMDVFFSGTDSQELIDNCGFHNFYLSLIVNNKNEMCAKIAFKARTFSENHLTINFLDQNGKDKQKKLVNKKEEDCIYVYNCKIEKSEGEVEDTFKSRFQEVKHSKESKRLLGESIREKALKGSFNVDERWRQAGLFDDIKGSGVFMRDKEVIGKKASVVERATKTDPRVYSLLSKLLSLDYIYEGTLSNVLKKLDHEFFPEDFGDVSTRSSHKVNMYCDNITQKAVEFYIDSFSEDFNLLNFDNTMERCVEILETYESEFPELITYLTEALIIEIK